MPYTLLIVEDDQFLSDTYQAKFANDAAGNTVLVANDGMEALELVQEHRPDVILLDLLMPRMGGIDFLRELKKTPEGNEIPVLVASNLDDEDIMNEAMDLGAKEYFLKSNVGLADLKAMIDRYATR